MRFLLSTCAIAVCLASSGYTAEEKTTAADSVEFDGQRLVFAFESNNPGEHFKEYIPQGENLDSWTKLAAIREYSKIDDPKQLAERMAQLLKKQNPDAQSAIAGNPKTGAVVLDFVTWPPDHSFVEFNVFKIEKQEPHGIVAEQYAVRDYKDVIAFLKNLKPLRTKLRTAMIEDGLTQNEATEQ